MTNPPENAAMESSTHTPGPWLTARTSEGEGYVLSVRHQSGGTQHAIAAVWDDNSLGLAEGIANARLIAAAPDLLDVCQKVSEAARLAGTLGPLAQAARAAIAKARGKS